MQAEKPLDPEIEELLIDNSKIFESDDISKDDKKFILDLIDRTDFSFNTNIFDQDDDATTVGYNMDLDKVATVDYNNENNDVGWHNSLETIQEAKEDDLMDATSVKNEFEEDAKKLEVGLKEPLEQRTRRKKRKLG